MIRKFSFAASSTLALCGGSLAVLGVMEESFKTAIIGIVLIFTAGVFATLYLGTRTIA